MSSGLRPCWCPGIGVEAGAAWRWVCVCVCAAWGHAGSILTLSTSVKCKMIRDDSSFSCCARPSSAGHCARRSHTIHFLPQQDPFGRKQSGTITGRRFARVQQDSIPWYTQIQHRIIEWTTPPRLMRYDAMVCAVIIIVYVGTLGSPSSSMFHLKLYSSFWTFDTR